MQNAKKQNPEMQRVQYLLIFNGQVKEGEHLDVVKSRLVSLYKVDIKEIDRLFSAKGIIKRTNDYDLIMKYKSALTNVGCIVQIATVLDDELLENNNQSYKSSVSGQAEQLHGNTSHTNDTIKPSDVTATDKLQSSAIQLRRQETNNKKNDGRSYICPVCESSFTFKPTEDVLAGYDYSFTKCPNCNREVIVIRDECHLDPAGDVVAYGTHMVDRNLKYGDRFPVTYHTPTERMTQGFLYRHVEKTADKVRRTKLRVIKKEKEPSGCGMIVVFVVFLYVIFVLALW